MAGDRRDACATAGARKTREFEPPRDADGRIRISAIYGRNTFGLHKMREKLPAADYEKLQGILENGATLDTELAAAIAHAAKEWAIENGATHFTHWFQPLTGLTAEKHDAFLTFDDDQQAIERFDLSQLIQSEPDASSFPSGGMRATFEARGYTAWDISSPMFLMKARTGTTLCIPSAYLSYTGHALDEKTGLLRSVAALGKEMRALYATLGAEGYGRVTSTVGPEQEYFLVDRAFGPLRPDLLMAGRTVLGAPPAKGQQLDDHYFGAISPRVASFMSEFEYELYELGVPVKTRHNEVAPGQYEMAPIFEEAQVAADHNQLAMEVMRQVARRHDFKVFFHEKPFAGINGSGKHINWSLGARRPDGKWENVFEPGETPTKNIRFLVMAAATQRAILRHAGALRAAISGAGNDHRLGANEAPPAIISVFLGSTLKGIFDRLSEGAEHAGDTGSGNIDLGVAHLPDVKRDNTDRNRTSPFAFTGNKWEFRAAGSSQTISFPVTLLNTAMAESVREMNESMKAAMGNGASREDAVLTVLQSVAAETAAVRFEGDNYSKEWELEAERRGLPNLRKTPDALSHMAKPENHQFLVDAGVFSEQEVMARLHVRFERYVMDVEIEYNTLLELIDTRVVPAVSQYHGDLCSAVVAAKNAGMASPQSARAEEVGSALTALFQARDSLVATFDSVMGEEADADRARRVAYELMPAMDALRAVSDRLESITADSHWPLPRYSEMLFVR
jgi:glutamine synthetase